MELMNTKRAFTTERTVRYPWPLWPGDIYRIGGRSLQILESI